MLCGGVKSISFIDNILAFYSRYLPLFDIGMGWVFPAILGLIIGWIISLVKKQELRF